MIFVISFLKFEGFSWWWWYLCCWQKYLFWICYLWLWASN